MKSFFIIFFRFRNVLDSSFEGNLFLFGSENKFFYFLFNEMLFVLFDFSIGSNVIHKLSITIYMNSKVILFQIFFLISYESLLTSHSFLDFENYTQILIQLQR